MPAASTARDGVFCEGEAQALGDGLAPWSGYHREPRGMVAGGGDADA